MAETEVDLGFGGLLVPLRTHMASFYRNLSELRGVVVPFVRRGLKGRARCICVVEEETRDGLQQCLQGPDVDIDAALACGQLSIFTAEESYLSLGYFSPDKMIEFYEAHLRRAVDEGYREIRISGEMTWALRDFPGVERLMEYEAKVHRMLINFPTITICHYNVTKCRGDMVMDSLRVHPACILGGVVIRNHFYMSPDDFLKHLEARTH